MDPAVYGLIGVALGGIIGVTSTLLVTLVTNKSLERRQLRELAVTAAVEDYKAVIEIGKMQRGPVQYEPLPTYVVFMLSLMERIGDTSKLTPVEVRKIFEQVFEQREELTKLLEERHANKKP